jgi:hypothetical protein
MTGFARAISTAEKTNIPRTSYRAIAKKGHKHISFKLRSDPTPR